MKKNTKILLISLLSVLFIVLVVVELLLNGQSNNLINNDTSIKEDNTSIIEKPKPPVELKQETIDDLKNNVGKGSDGDVVKVEEGKDDNNNRTYTYTFKDGNTQTITIRKETEEERIKREENVNQSNNNTEDKEPIIEENNPQENHEELIEEETGTVYERYMNMSSEEKAAFYLSFDNTDDFFIWLSNAEAEYKALHPTIVVGENEVIDFGS